MKWLNRNVLNLILCDNKICNRSLYTSLERSNLRIYILQIYFSKSRFSSLKSIDPLITSDYLSNFVYREEYAKATRPPTRKFLSEKPLLFETPTGYFFSRALRKKYTSTVLIRHIYYNLWNWHLLLKLCI